MKKIIGRLLLPAAVLTIIALAVFFWPRDTGALNPNHSDCSICHSLHDSAGQALTDYAVSEDLCLSCHGPAGISTLKATVHTNKSGSSYPAFTMTCLDCHNPHDSEPNWMGGTNLKMVGTNLDGTGVAKISTPNSGDRYVTFESRGTDAGGPSLHSFADDDEDGNGVYDGVCETCHTQALNHRNNSSGNHSHYPDLNCITCHPHDGNFHGSGGGCTGCHSAVATEFALTSHHAAGGTVSDDDCAVCHYEAQGAHADTYVDLLNPDTGARLTAFTALTRNTASDSLESTVLDVQNNFCLKCHDSNGATATYSLGSGADATHPFSTGGAVPNTNDQFDTANFYHHAVRGAGNNPYCVPSGTNGNNITMEPPWNQDSTHDVISCFDCHETNGHGSSNQRMLRTSVDLDAMEAGTLTSGTGVETFCSLCHKASVYVNAGDPESVGSIFEYHGGNTNQHGAAGGNELGCMGCHGGIINWGKVPDNGAQRGNIHGGSFTWPTDTWSPNSPTQYFIVGGWISGWKINTSAGNNGCGGGDCSHVGSPRQQKPGKEYTN